MEQSKFYQIKNVTEHEYTLVGCNGSVITRPIQDIDKLASVFTIRDTKKGDVLATDSGDLCLFDGTIEEGKYPFAYCGLTRHGFEFYDRTLPFTHDYVYPATQKQCDLFFQKMKEAGYKWDINKKELIKLEIMKKRFIDTREKSESL